MKTSHGPLLTCLRDLINTPSPTGYTDNIVRFVSSWLRERGVAFELTRRGAIRATLRGRDSSTAKAVACHLDTIGAMVKALKPNGRLQMAPIGHWSCRAAENARATVVTDDGRNWRGTVLPLKASGHTFGEEIDTQEVSWDHIELRMDAPVSDDQALRGLGFDVGDYVMFDTGFEIIDEGYVVSRHLDNKAGAAVLLHAIERVITQDIQPAVDCHLLFTISEEVGSGASAVLHGDVAEMVTLDNSTVAQGQNSIESGITIAMMDSSGPFDYHLTKYLVDLCKRENLHYAKDVFKYYRCDAASAVEAGNDLRTAVACFGLDASHGIERTHVDSLTQLTHLVAAYLESPPLFARDRSDLGPFKDFPDQPKVPFADVVVASDEPASPQD